MPLNPKAKTFTPKAKTPTPKAKTPTPKAKTPTPKAKTPTPKAKTPTPKAKTRTTIKKCGSPSLPRCKKGTRCNKKTGNCEPTGKKLTIKPTKKKTVALTVPNDSLNIMQYQEEELKELGLKKNDFYEDVCLVLKNIRKKLNIPGKENENEWSRKKLIKLHSLIPHTRDKSGKLIKGENVNQEQYLGDKEIKFINILGKGGYGRIHGGTYGGRPCAIKESLEPMNDNNDIEEYYSEIIKQNELFCQVHRSKLSEPKYAKIPKPLFVANMDKTPLLGMEPLDDSLYNFIKLAARINQGQLGDRRMDTFTFKLKMTKVLTDMFECICNTLIYLQEKYDFYHRDMHCGNIMYRKIGETYKWYLIDFGFSTFKLHNYRFSEKGAGPYGSYNEEKAQQGKSHKGRVGHDLRLTLLFMFQLVEDQLDKMIIPEAFNILLNIYLQIKYDIMSKGLASKKNFWHNGYNDAFNKLVTTETEPKNFLKDTIPKLRLAITNYKSAQKITTKTKTKSPTKTKKEYVYVQRNKSLKRPTLGGTRLNDEALIINHMMNIVNGYIILINSTSTTQTPNGQSVSVRKKILDNAFNKIKQEEGENFIHTIKITFPSAENQVHEIPVDVENLFTVFPLDPQHDPLEIEESENVITKLTNLRTGLQQGNIPIEKFNNSLQSALTRDGLGLPYLGSSVFHLANDDNDKSWAGVFLLKIISHIGSLTSQAG